MIGGTPISGTPPDVFLRFCVLFLVPGIWEDRDCCHFLHHTINITLGGGVGWGGVGWGGVGWDNNVIGTSTHTWCNITVRSLALHSYPHIRHATLLQVLLLFHTYVMLRCCRFSCSSTHTSCYAAVGSLALPHTHTHVMLRCCRFSCTSTHTSCFTAVGSLDNDDDDVDDYDVVDDDDIAYETKVSILSLFNSPI